MNWFKNMTTMAKLMLGFGLVGVILAFVGYMGIHGIDQVDNNVVTLDRHVQGVAHLADAREGLLMISRGVSNGVADLAFKDYAALDNRIANSKKYEENFKKALSGFEKVIERDDLKTKAAAIDKEFVDLTTKAEKVYGEAKANRLIEAHNELTELRSISDDLEKKMADLVDVKMASVDKDTKDAAALAQSTTNFTWGIAVIAILAALALGYLIAKLIAKPLIQTVGILKQVAGGDLTPRLDVDTKDEVGQMGAALNQALDSLGTAMRTINDSAQTLASSSEELTSVSHQMSSNSEETATQANVVSAASEQVSKNVQTVAAGAEEMSASIKEISKNTTDAARVAKEAVDVAEKTNQTITQLGASSAEIGNVIKVITSIAEQTNLLALNATIEAARAGEAGKGFAVVANEVKELAKQTGEATEDISQKISAIQHDTQGAVTAIQQIGGIINQVNDIANTIASAVEEQTVTTNEMSRNVSEAAKGSNEIVQNITGVAQAAQSTASGATQTQAAAQELARLATELQTSVNQFKIDAAAHETKAVMHVKEKTLRKGSAMKPQPTYQPASSTLHTL